MGTEVKYVVNHGTVKGEGGVVYKPGQEVPGMSEQTALALEKAGVISIHHVTTVEPMSEPVFTEPPTESKPKRRGRRKKR